LGLCHLDFTSVFYIIYSISRFSSGFIADKTNVKYMLDPGLIAIGILNFCLDNSTSIYVIMLLYSSTAILQSSGFTPIAIVYKFLVLQKRA